MQSKKCSKCQLVKNLSEFVFRNKNKGQYHSRCKNCKNRKTNICKCGELIQIKSVKCKKCKILDEQDKISKFTIEDKIDKNNEHSNKYGYIRFRAREVGKLLEFSCCSSCGYDKHFEVCHIKSISDFPLNTLISEVNKPENLMPLCPNCHWEFDNGLLKMADIGVEPIFTGNEPD